jgi:hypothetical protein
LLAGQVCSFKLLAGQVCSFKFGRKMCQIKSVTVVRENS